MQTDITLEDAKTVWIGMGTEYADQNPAESEVRLNYAPVSYTHLGIVPEIIVSHVEEKITSDVPAEVVMSLAEQKAVDVAKEMPEGTVILGSDTVVAADGKILGKPKSHEEAYEMIRRCLLYTSRCV